MLVCSPFPFSFLRQMKIKMLFFLYFIRHKLLKVGKKSINFKDTQKLNCKDTKYEMSYVQFCTVYVQFCILILSGRHGRQSLDLGSLCSLETSTQSCLAWLVPHCIQETVFLPLMEKLWSLYELGKRSQKGLEEPFSFAPLNDLSQFL